MKRIVTLLILVVAIVAFGASAKSKEKQQPKIEFTKTSHDFGTVAEKGGPVKCEFEFTNTGTAPLLIMSATASCGCTRPGFPDGPIQPGKKGVIKVTYLPDGRPGEFNKTLKVRTNESGGKRVTLKISGTVIPAKK